MSDDYREIHSRLMFYKSTPWLISKTLIYLTNKEINIKFYTSFPNFNWNANRLVSEYHTCDTSVGYPPGLTRVRLISFTRNIVNRGFSQKILFYEKRWNSTIHDSRLFCFTQRCRNIITFTKTLVVSNSVQTISAQLRGIVTNFLFFYFIYQNEKNLYVIYPDFYEL
jgi:hypothetical protein